ncbi:MAG: serine/threonine protein kinase [Planctomycetes bacterium]|nr:serine/threonine protein kinase [Planctomycetota bacterium]
MALETEHALPAGHLLHHYRIEHTLGGNGPVNFVYLAHDTKRNAPVVIKEYLPSGYAMRMDDQAIETVSEVTPCAFRQGRQLFFDEATALAKIEHPNIVRVTDAFLENSTVYLVMAYEDGQELHRYIKQHRGGLSEKSIHMMFLQLLEGLRALHDHHRLHLDIKPANIYLLPDGRPLLFDVGAVQAPTGIQRCNVYTLTPGFAPLEQHERRHIGPWTDLYALGASMYTCMCGRAPPAAPERAALDIYKPARRRFARRYSRTLLDAVDWCLTMDPLQRPQRADDLLIFLNQKPRKRPPEPPDSLSSWLRAKLRFGRS